MLRQNYPDTVFTLNNTTGVSTSQAFTLGLYDFNTLVAKLEASALSGTSPTLDVYIQTQDPSTGTYYDLVHFTQLTAAVTDANAYFAKFGDMKADAKYVGAPGQSNIAAGSVSGLPLLSRGLKVIFTYGGTVGTANATLTIQAVDQDIR